MRWHCEVDKALPLRWCGDAGRLRQILLNLVGNAVKFTERGEIALFLQRHDGDGRHVMMKVVVRDTGIGIPLDAQTRIFDPFSQADGSTSRRFGGTRLGLAIVQRLVDMMGGQIGGQHPREGIHVLVYAPIEARRTNGVIGRNDVARLLKNPGPQRICRQDVPNLLMFQRAEGFSSRKMIRRIARSCWACWSCADTRRPSSGQGPVCYRPLNHSPFDLIFMGL